MLPFILVFSGVLYIAFEFASLLLVPPKPIIPYDHDIFRWVSLHTALTDIVSQQKPIILMMTPVIRQRYFLALSLYINTHSSRFKGHLDLIYFPGSAF